MPHSTAPPGRVEFHLRHGADRHAGLRHDHSGIAHAGAEFRGRERGACRANVRPVRHRLGADADHLLAGARIAVGSFWTAAGDPHLLRRSRPRLHSDGAGAESVVAAGRPGDIRHHRGELQHGRRLYLGRHAARKARREFWLDRSCIRHRIRAGSGIGRHPRRDFAAAAVLGFGLHGPGQCLLGPVCAARIPAQGKARTFFLEERPSLGSPQAAALSSPARGPRRQLFPHESRARGAACDHRAVHALPLWLGYDVRWASCSPGWESHR